MAPAFVKLGLWVIASRVAVVAFDELPPKRVYLVHEPDRGDGGCKNDEQFMVIKTIGNLKDFKKYELTFSQKNGKCGKTMANSALTDLSGVFQASDVGISNGLSLYVCAPHGFYELELEILDKDSETKVSGEIGWEIYQGTCGEEPQWKMPREVRAMGSYDFSVARGSPLYAGPNPADAPECEADNYLGLGVDTAPAGSKLEGCYFNDKRNMALDGYSHRHNQLDAKRCADDCEGYQYFGTTDGDRCVCGNKAPDTDMATNCYTPCNGKPRVACGGCSAITVFKRDGPVGPSPATTHKLVNDGAMWKYVACFEDDVSSRVLRGPRRDSASGMTTKACFEFCEGFMYFGTQHGQECYCGTSEPSTKSMECNMSCTGNAAETCGGIYAISVYKRDGPGGASPTTLPHPASTPGLKDDSASGAKNMGCFEDDGRNRVLDEAWTESRDMMDAEYCSDFCKGYQYFGTEFGQECLCGKSEPSQKSNACNMSCTGKRGVICGGQDAITIFKRDGDGVCGGVCGGGKMESIGCYEDDGMNRIMKMAYFESDSMTPEVCGDFCKSKSSRAKYFGVQFGKECFCSDNSSFMDKDPIGPHACDMYCSGDRTTYCGGRDVMNAYKL